MTAAVMKGITARPSASAETIRFHVIGPLTLSLSIESLETFAESGEITGNLKLFNSFLDDQIMAELRQGLQQRLQLDVVQTYNLSYSPLGRKTIAQIGKLVRFTPKRNGFYGLRAALLGAAANSDGEGWTILDAIAQFPTETIEVNVQDLLQLRRILEDYLDYKQAVVQAIETRAQKEVESQWDLNLTNLSDLSQLGSYDFELKTLTVNNPALRKTKTGLSVNYDFPVNVFIPQGLSQPAPIIIVSHGFGAIKDNFVFIAEHLASYGFVVVVPEHIGSNLSFRQTFLEGRLNTLLSPIEFVNRPQEISFLIDQLEELVASDSQWEKLLNIKQIGLLGDSLGGTTVLSLAGANVNHARLIETCNQENIILNVSLFLQCRAQFLPPQNFYLGDPRIKAAISGHPLTSGIFGPEGMSRINIPLMMVAGSDDLVTPVVTEQIHPFVWMESESKYLALFKPGTHFATSEQSAEGSESIPPILMGKHQEFGRQYFKGLNVAFFETYLRGRSDFLPYLSSAYAQAISKGNPMSLEIITSLTPKELETAYDGNPPIPVVPEPIESIVTIRKESIIDQIQRTGVLKVAMRLDAPPFGYIDSQKEWSGYCGDLAVALKNYLANKLGLDLEIELAQLPSTLENRFSLLQEDTVHLECGPNTIRQDLSGITFSSPIGVSGTRFLSQLQRQTEINPNLSLEGLRVGVLKNTTTEKFVQNNYPQAELVYFEGPQGRESAVKAVSQGHIDAFAGDSILSLEEVNRQNLSLDNYILQPRQPLTCDFYGLLLPNDDPQWRAMINEFIADSSAQQKIREKWLNSMLYTELNDLQYCLNR
ncbi:putative dienelactone hydrolase [Xenococcus sp. PCC 7305]|uniref:alpha/beta fold hydrolase n=1 Tax=Xenococcus sp. PCC 7305 TaxID=102125 RepID=UPI0002AC2555|nr:alpha/beta fold hydrolase [Xenococcus sp. PCC 7305]ELS02203.1 putative dienelactone hydrolase [Xenococcus sp. PCC 7305]